MLPAIEVTYENSAFDVNLKLNAQHSEQIGFQIKTLGEAMQLAEAYQQIDKTLRIRVSSIAKANIDPYKEMGIIAESIGLAPNSFNGVVDTLLEYCSAVKREERCLKKALALLQASQTIN